MKRKILIFIIALFIMGNVSAVSITQFPTDIYTDPDNGGGKTSQVITLDYSKDYTKSDYTTYSISPDSAAANATYAYFPLKHITYNENKIYYSCTSDEDRIPSGKCTATTLDYDKNRNTKDFPEKGVAYIINLINSEENEDRTDDEKYWWSEFLIKSYLGKYDYTFGQNTYDYIYENDRTILNTGMTYKQIKAAAAAAEAKVYEDVTLSVNTKPLTFTYDEATDIYHSNEITVTSNKDYNIVLSNNKFEIQNQGNNKYKFIIRGEKISEGSSESLKVTINSKVNSQTYYVSQNYDCGSGVQTVTPLVTVKKTTKVADPIELSASVKKEKGTIKVSKLDEAGNVLAGAQIKIEKTDKTYSNIITTTNTATILNNLEYGEYVITEIESPEGYILNKKSQKIILSDSNVNVEVKITNKKTKVSVIKISAENNKPLSDAKLHIEDTNGNKIKEWITDSSSYVVEGLAYGTYYIVEDSAPKGYVLNKEKTKFVIDSNTDNLEIKIKNKLTTVEISKISAVDNKELKGATLQILDKDKNKMSCAVKKDEKVTELLEECTWVSGDESKIIVGLLPGKYYLKELIAPEGYVLNEEMIEFEVEEDGTANPVTMKNELEVEVPNTLSSRSTLLIAISMFDIALGIGILTYVKKYKAEE